MDKPQKNHISSVLVSIFKMVKEMTFFIVILLVKLHLKGVIAIASMILIIIILAFIKWHKTLFYISDDILVYETGILKKNVLKLSIDKITTVDLEQSIVQKFFNTFRLKIDSGSIQSNSTEIDIVLAKEAAFKVRDIILSADTEVGASEKRKIGDYYEDKKNIFEVSLKELLIDAITKNNFVFGLGVIFSAFTFLDDILDVFGIKVSETLDKYFNISELSSKSMSLIIISILQLITFFWIVSIIFSIASNIIKLYGFKVYKQGENIKIEYGLINKKAYSLPTKNIHAITLKQNFIKQKFNLYNVEVTTIGYGNEEKEEAILYPTANIEFVRKLIYGLAPEFRYECDMFKPPKEAISKFLFIPITIAIAFCLVLTKIVSKGYLSFLILPLVVLSGYINFKNTSMGFDDNIFVGAFGGFYKKIVVVKIPSIQSLSMTSNYFQRRKNLCSYNVEYYGNKLNSSIDIKHLKNSYFVELKEKIDY